MPKISVGVSFSVHYFGEPKKFGQERGDYQDFPSKILCLTVPEYFVGEPFCAVFRKISGIEKKSDKRGGASRLSVEIFVVSHCQKFL